jgi:hypothetical protein
MWQMRFKITNCDSSIDNTTAMRWNGGLLKWLGRYLDQNSPRKAARKKAMGHNSVIDFYRKFTAIEEDVMAHG